MYIYCVLLNKIIVPSISALCAGSCAGLVPEPCAGLVLGSCSRALFRALCRAQAWPYLTYLLGGASLAGPGAGLVTALCRPCYGLVTALLRACSGLGAFVGAVRLGRRGSWAGPAVRGWCGLVRGPCSMRRPVLWQPLSGTRPMHKTFIRKKPCACLVPFLVLREKPCGSLVPICF